MERAKELAKLTAFEQVSAVHIPVAERRQYRWFSWLAGERVAQATLSSQTKSLKY
jgi:hypothetical protein